MRRAGTTRAEARLLAGLAAEIERQLAAEGPASAAAAAIERLGLGVVITVEAVPGPAAPRVRVPDRAPSVPEWSPEDEDILRSLGIAGDGAEGHDGSTSKPGGRHSG